MRVGLMLPQVGALVSAASVRAFSRSAEKHGFASLWVQERLFRPLEPRSGYVGTDEAIPEDYSCVLSPLELLAAVAGWTDTTLLGTSVLVVGYHHPVELARRLATIDHLSGGRVVVGLGVGWSKDEHELMGVDFAHRGRRSDEFLQALLACWGDDPVEFDGDFFKIPVSQVGPKPVQRPHPPLILGMSSRRGRERTVRYADGWHPGGGDISRVLATLEEMNASREPEQQPLSVHLKLFLEPPTPSMQAKSLDDLVGDIRQAATAGIDEVILDLAGWEQASPGDDMASAPERLAFLVDIVEDV